MIDDKKIATKVRGGVTLSLYSLNRLWEDGNIEASDLIGRKLALLTPEGSLAKVIPFRGDKKCYKGGLP